MTTETAWVWDQENRCCFRVGTLRVHLTVDDESGDPENAPEWVVTKDIVGRIVRDHNLANFETELVALRQERETWRDWQKLVEAARANAAEAIRQFNGMQRRAVDAEAHLDAARERLALIEADTDALKSK